MGCRSDYMEPTALETYSRQTAKNLKYVLEQLKLPVLTEIIVAAQSPYGDSSKADYFTASLCQLLTTMTSAKANKIIYNGASKDARDLADWWEDHQEVDKRREAAEQADKNRLKFAKRAVDKITENEANALLSYILEFKKLPA